MRRAAVAAHARPSDAIAAAQIASTLGPLALLWTLIAHAAGAPWIVVGATVAIALFQIRVFVLMHDCGHNSLFRTVSLNRAVGFVLGVIAGIPQYVWSKHHAFHHATNGDWSRYAGPMSIISVDAYLARSEAERRRYRRARHVANAPLAGLLYLVVTPQLNWIAGTAQWVAHVARGVLPGPREPLAARAAAFRTRRWSSWKEYRHMTASNLSVLAAWIAMSWAVGPMLFLGVHLVATALAGGAALVLFTVQHNFEHSYASDTAGWDPDDAVLHGTSMLVLPAWANWFTADIAYHHVHHLSASVPNYRLAGCHAACAALFVEVRRLSAREVPGALRCILWDMRARRIVTVEEALAGR